jgi:hypothetical protein
MTLIGLIVVLVILGVVVYVVNAVIPMDARFKLIVNAIIIVAVLLWVLEQFGLLSGPHIRLH